MSIDDYSPTDLPYNQLKALVSRHDRLDNLVRGKIGIAEDSPSATYHVLVKIEDDWERENKYTENYKALCGHMHESSTLVLDATKCNIQDRSFCGHCRKRKIKYLALRKDLRKHGIEVNP
jgi:hypothetical protein